MAHPVTSPAEWRRVAGPDPSTPRPPAEGPTELDRLVGAAWDDPQADTAAIRALVWDQQHDVPGVRIGPDQYVMAHAGPQRGFATLGWATALLVDRFEATGDDDDLAAASELHDLTAALGDDVWTSPDNGPIALGAAALYDATGEPAFLATVERMADMLCEVRPLTADNAAILAACADLVEPRAALEQLLAEADG